MCVIPINCLNVYNVFMCVQNHEKNKIVSPRIVQIVQIVPEETWEICVSQMESLFKKLCENYAKNFLNYTSIS